MGGLHSFDGADALIATKLRERGMVSIEAVEWFKRRLSPDLNIKQEEIEEWMRQQQDEFQMMMRDAERMGVRRRKQVSAFGLIFWILSIPTLRTKKFKSL